jgi:hypothetical protein
MGRYKWFSLDNQKIQVLYDFSYHIFIINEGDNSYLSSELNTDKWITLEYFIKEDYIDNGSH